MYRHLRVGFIILLFFILLSGMNNPVPGTFKYDQKKFERVKQAYSQKEHELKTLLAQKGFSYNNFSLLLLACKYERELQVFVRDSGNKKFELLKTYEFCVLSGDLGPKRKEGDGQVPEGLYQISRFNPRSNFHLSLKINYPNASDRILSDKTRPGGEIYIHGNCVSVGCIPITDECIKELYILCVEAWDRYKHIPVYIFPFKMTDSLTEEFKSRVAGTDVENLWTDLKAAYDEFSQNRDIIRFKTDKKGRYVLQ